MTLGATNAAAQNRSSSWRRASAASRSSSTRRRPRFSVENFLQYANDGFYDGLVFHRVIQTFMIQGGGFDSDMNQKSDVPPSRTRRPTA